MATKQLGAKQKQILDISLKSEQLQKLKTSCLILGLFEDEKLSPSLTDINQLTNKAVSKLIKSNDLTGKLGKSTLILNNFNDNLSIKRFLIVGLGKKEQLTPINFLKATQAAIKYLNNTQIKDATIAFSELTLKDALKTQDLAWKVKSLASTAGYLKYTFNKFKSKQPQPSAFTKLTILHSDSKLDSKTNKNLELAIKQGQACANGINLTRDLANTPANICTPEFLAKQAKELTKLNSKLKCKILEEKDLKQLKMGSFLSVTAGSTSKAKLICLEYNLAASNKKSNQKPLVLIGKGITFDTGGNSIKPAANMIGMKFDMCGAATVLGVIKAIIELKLDIPVVGLVPACENMPGPDATRPDDIITSMNGTTIEVLNTDAEGRLILADALTYAERYNPESVIDMATLTGACVVALGHHASAVMSNHQPLANELIQAGETSLDRAWQLPIWDIYAESLKSNFADVANVSLAGGAGTITAACFLAKFAKKFNWAHLDIAGTASYFSGNEKGATGRPVSLLMDFILNRTK